MLELQIHGRPVALNSTKQAKTGHFYNPKQKELDQAKWQIRSQFNQKPYQSAVRIEGIFYFHVPKNTSSVKRKQMLANIIKHDKRPDRGNLEKFVEDVLQGIVIDDDAKFWKGTFEKRWCDTEDDEKTLIYLFPDLYQDSLVEMS